jgi:hypothetical protein
MILEIVWQRQLIVYLPIPLVYVLNAHLDINWCQMELVISYRQVVEQPIQMELVHHVLKDGYLTA